ncbi:hypothetical protein BU24DRAFT_409901 [Aaosphaeria arxii CBS 175.79]|uniref:Mid2 domain-containing protein n=1 Tax=Aaosphaeria arxii CBS 175.79 TaxID=1450172 RepID=A0A6A5XP55_9PLEO|nr:uncharacterized protein BU24DRAFT_409901 [Aaosphaeria arxii CBS 175.79]KAF2014134.1 hypothetical protein BU24DRAFT_409901 [Aaosphaeria arxii CBS 175.79]
MLGALLSTTALLLTASSVLPLADVRPLVSMSDDPTVEGAVTIASTPTAKATRTIQGQDEQYSWVLDPNLIQWTPSSSEVYSLPTEIWDVPPTTSTEIKYEATSVPTPYEYVAGKENRLSGKIIALIIIGAFVTVGIIGVIIFKCIQHRQRRKARSMEHTPGRGRGSMSDSRMSDELPALPDKAYHTSRQFGAGRHY